MGIGANAEIRAVYFAETAPAVLAAREKATPVGLVVCGAVIPAKTVMFVTSVFVGAGVVLVALAPLPALAPGVETAGQALGPERRLTLPGG